MQNSLIAILFFTLPFPVHRLFIDGICSDLPELSWFETICREGTPEATSRIETESVGSDTQSLCCPVTIDDELLSCIALVPWSTIDESYESSEFCWGIYSKIRMQSTMHEDEVFFFYNLRKGEEPLCMICSFKEFEKISRFFLKWIYPSWVF